MPEPTSEAKPRRSWLLKRVVPLAAVLIAAIWYFRSAPRDVSLVCDLTGKRDGLVSLQVEILRLPDRELARHIEYHYSASAPAPPQQRMSTRLAPGDYEADISLVYSAHSDRVERRFSFAKQEEIMLAPP